MTEPKKEHTVAKIPQAPYLAKDELRALSGCKTILRAFVATLSRSLNVVTMRSGFDGSDVGRLNEWGTDRD